MEQTMTITTYNQLKSLGDPLRAEMMMQLVMQPYTGQQLAELLDIPRGKIHYHLKDLEKNGFVKIVKTEEKNGIIQKFYQATATDFTIADALLPHKKEIDQTLRHVLYSLLDRAKRKVRSAPDYAFEAEKSGTNSEARKFISTTAEIKATESQFKEWKKKYNQLMRELEDLGEKTTEKTKNTYYIFTLGFQIEESEMDKRIEE